MVCKDCGAKISDTVAFCTNCGVKIIKNPAAESLAPNAGPVSAESAMEAVSPSDESVLPISEQTAAAEITEAAASPAENVSVNIKLTSAEAKMDSAAPDSGGGTLKKTPAAPTQAPLPRRFARAGLSAFLAFLIFISTGSFAALLILRPANIARLISAADVFYVLEKRGFGDEIIGGLNDLGVAGVNIDAYGLNDLLKRKNVSDEIGKLAERYLTAVAEGDYEYHVTEREFVGFLRAISPDIRAEFDYRLSSEDYEQISKILNENASLKNYRAGGILADAGLSPALLYLIFSIYAAAVTAIIVLMSVVNVFLLHRKKLRKSLLTIGMPVGFLGVLFVLIGLFTGPLSETIRNGPLYDYARMASGVSGVTLVSGLAAIFFAFVSFAFYFIINGARKNPPPVSAAKKSETPLRYAGLALNVAAFFACAVLAVICFVEIPAAPGSLTSAKNDANKISAGGSAANNDREPSADPHSDPTDPRVGEIMEFGGSSWLVLDIHEGRALLFGETIFEFKAYHETLEDVTWERSDIRRYLNGEFFERFGAADRARVIETRVINGENPWTFSEWAGRGDNTPGGNNTLDKIFLLSVDEVLVYFGDSGLIEKGKNETARGDSIEYPGHGVYSWGVRDRYSQSRIAHDASGAAPGQRFWLRSPGYTPLNAVCVDGDGDLFMYGCVATDSAGVRPALWLELTE